MENQKTSPKNASGKSDKPTHEGKSKKKHRLYYIVLSSMKNPPTTSIEDEKKIKIIARRLDDKSSELEDLFTMPIEGEKLIFKPYLYQCALDKLAKGQVSIKKELEQTVFVNLEVCYKEKPFIDPKSQSSMFLYQLEPQTLDPKTAAYNPVLKRPIEFLYYFFRFGADGDYDLAKDLFNDFDKKYQEDDYTEYTEKLWKVISYLDKKGPKSSKIFLPLKFIKLDYEGKLGNEITDVIPRVEEISLSQGFQVIANHPIRDSFARFFAFLIINMPSEFIKLQRKIWYADSQKIADNILSVPKIKLDKAYAETILLMLLDTSASWDITNVVEILKLYSLYAKDFRTLVQNTRKFTKEFDIMMESEEMLARMVEKLVTQAKEEKIKSLDLLFLVKGHVFVQLAKKLLRYSRSIKEIEELYAVVWKSDDEETREICTESIPKALKEMSLQSLLQEILFLVNTKEFVEDSVIYDEFQKKFENQTLKGILELNEKDMKLSLNKYPRLIQPLFQRVIDLTKTETEMTDYMKFLALYKEFLVESEKFWGKDGLMNFIKASISKIVELSLSIKGALAHFETVLKFGGTFADESKDLCNHFWSICFNNYGMWSLFKDISLVSQIETAEIKDTYSTFLVKKIGPMITTAEEFGTRISLLFPGGVELIDLRDPLMDHVFSQLLAKLELPSTNVFSIIPQLDQNHAWAKILCFQNGEKYKKVEQYQKIRELISFAATQISSLSCTIAEARLLANLSESQINILHKKYFNKIDPNLNCRLSFTKIKEICAEVTNSKQHMDNILEKYLKRANDYSKAKALYDEYWNTLPAVSIEGYKEFAYKKPFGDIAEKIYNISSSKLFDQRYQETLSKGRTSSMEEILMSLRSSLQKMEEDIKQKLIAPEPVSAEFIEHTIAEIKTYEEKKDEMVILAQCFGLEETRKSALLEFIEVLRRKDEFIKNAEVIIRFSDYKGFSADPMIQELTEMRITLQQNKIAFTEMVKVFNQIQGTYSNIFGDKTLLEVLEIYTKEERLRDFVLQKDENEIRTMIEVIGDFGDLTIKASETAYLFELKTLFFWIEKEKNTMKETLEALQNQLLDKSYSKIISKMYFCKDQLSLLEQLASKKEALNAIIRSVVTKGIAKISLKRSSYTAILTTSGSKAILTASGSKAKREVKIDEAIQIRDRVHLTLKADEMMQSQTSQWTSENMRDFQIRYIEVIDLIEDILIILNSLFQKGYPKLEKRFTIDCHHKKDLISEKEKFKAWESQWDELIREAYQQHYILTLLYGRQFNKLLDYLQNKPESPSQETRSILRHLFGKSFKDEKFDDYHPQGGNAEVNLTELGAYLEGKIPHSRHYSVCHELNNVKKKILVVTSAASLIECVCTLYLHKTGELPTFSNCLYCHKNSSIEEINAFVRRYIQCPNKSLFTVMRIEDLDGSCQERFVQILTEENQSESPQRQVSAVLAILVADIDAPIAKQLKTLGFFQEKILSYDQATFDKYFQEKLKSKPRIVTSDEAGIGKGQWIYQKNQNRNYFPISGSINFGNILKRLAKLDMSSDSSLHIDIGHILEDDSKTEMDRILFSLIILGGISSFEYLFTLPEKCEMYIELHKSSSNIPFLKLLRANYENLKQLQPITPRFIPSSHIVFNVLALYDKGSLPKTDFSTTKFEENKVDAREAQNLLDKYFLKDVQSHNFYKIKIFLLLAADLLSQFTKSVFFFNSSLSFTKTNLEIKNAVCQVIIEYSKEYTVRSIDYAMSCQRRALQNKGNEGDIEIIDSSEDTLGFESMKNFSLIFNDSGCFMPIYKDETQVPKKIMDLIKSQRLDIYQPPTDGKKIKPDFKKPFELENYVQMDSNSWINKLCDFVGINNQKEIESLYEACKSYVLTADNYYKMCLLYSKCRARIPVIIMGQAGCGKTSLVQFLAEKILKEHFRKITFHAGITPKLLKKELKDIRKEAEILQSDGKRLWLFLDEINTSETLNLVEEMMTHDSYQGEPLPENIQYLAAINPYAKQSKKGDIGLLVRNKYRKVQELKYNVLPLPDSLFNFVWNFGQLSNEDEISYLNQMLRNSKMTEEVREVGLNCMIESHNFIRKKEGSGSVSLRDAKRFIVIYAWFSQSLKVRKELASHREKMPSNMNNLGESSMINVELELEREQMQSIVLALSICYLTRLENVNTRMAYILKMSNVIQSTSQTRFGYYTSDRIFEIIDNEQEEYLERIKKCNNRNLMKGIAHSTALKENLFTMLVCLMNRIPVIICGEPGCSKTLSFQLLLNSLRGPDSKDEYFKTLPRLLVFTYQGSYHSTSEGILRVFDKAQRVLNDNYQPTTVINSEDFGGKNAEKETRNIISVVFFDEMGLAELSKNNPLKVLHSLLEYNADTTQEDLKMRVGFVGISNWRLDMSKMSRVIFVARSQPTLKDLKETADSIIQSFERNSLGFESYTQTLAEAYFDFRKAYETSHKMYQNFHGLRDFYSLMKEACKNIINTGLEKRDANTISECINDAIERNFGGLPDSAASFKRFLKLRIDYLKVSRVPFSVRKLIQLNFQDPTARYLMLIIRGNFGSQVISDQLGISSKKYQTIIGSQFEQDIDQDEYSAKILSTIINCLEEGISLIMQGLDTIYPSLYDLFNQNFTVISKKKTCKIAIGTTTNITCSVHDDFRCIVLVDEQQLADQEPPFLNRFEKQIVSWESILSDQNLIEGLKKIKAWLNRFCTAGNHHQKFVLSPQWIVINFSDENIACIVAEYWNENEEESAILDRIKKELLLTASADIIPASWLSEGAAQKAQRDELIEYYYQQPHQSLAKFLKVMMEKHLNNTENTPILKSIVYTYSTIFDPLGLDDANEFDEFKLSSISSERELDGVLSRFFENTKSCCILRFKVGTDDKYFALTKLLIERLATHYQPTLTIYKHVVVIFHLNRKDALEGKPQPLSITYMKGWNQIMIDSLQEVHYIDFKSIIHLNSKEVLQRKQDLIKSEQSLAEMVTDAYMKLNFNEFNSKSQRFQVNERIHRAIKLLTKNEKIRDILLDKINLQTQIDKDWLVEIVTDKQLLASSRDIYHAVEKFFSNRIQYSFLQLIYSLETSGGMQALLSLVKTGMNDPRTSTLFGVWTGLFQLKDHSHQVIQKNMQNIVKQTPETQVPFSFTDVMNCFQRLQLDDIIQEYKGILINLFESPDDRNSRSIKFQKLEQAEKKIEDSLVLSYIKNLNHESEAWKLCHELIQIDIGNIFTSYYLKCEEKYAKLIIVLMQDLVTDTYFFSEPIITLLSFQRALRTLIELHEFLAVQNSDVEATVKNYKEIKIKNRNRPVFENMLHALIKDIYPSNTAVARAGSWRSYGVQLSIALLHIQIVCKELDTTMDVIKLFMFWRDLIEVCLSINYRDNQIEDITSPLIKIQEELKLDDYQYREEAFPTCCEIFENLSKRWNLASNLKFLGLFSRYLVDSYKKTRDSEFAIEVIKKALSYPFLTSQLGSFLETVLSDADIYFDNQDLLVIGNQDILLILKDKLKEADRNSELSVHIDFLLGKFYIAEHFYSLKEEGSKISRSCLETLKDEFSRDHDEGVNIQTIGMLGIMKYLLDEYIQLLIGTSSKTVLSEEDCQIIENILNKQNNLHSIALRVYAIRNLCTKADDLNAIINLNMSQDWLRDLKSAQNEQKKSTYSGIGGDVNAAQVKFSQQFDEILKLNKNEKNYETSMLDFIKELEKNENSSLSSLTFIYNHIYWKFLQNEKPAVDFAPERFQTALGAARVQILQSLVTNFDKKYELLHLNPDHSPEKIQLTSIICHISVGILSKLVKKKKFSVYSFLIENNSFEGLAARVASSLIPGSEHENLKASTAYIVLDLERDSSISSSKCSCGFTYYYKASPELATAQLNCPCCNKNNDNPTKYQHISKLPKGAEYFLPLNMKNIGRKNYSVRSLKPLTYRILSLILHSLLYFMLAIGAISEEDLRKVLNVEPNTNCERLLRGCIESHWRLIAQMLELQENTYLFLHEAISQLIEKKASAEKFKNRSERNEWEEDFERTVLDPLVNLSSQVARGVQEILNMNKKSQKILEEVKELDVSVNIAFSNDDAASPLGDYPYAHLIRISRLNTFELFENAFRRCHQQKTFPLTDLYLKFKDPLECVSSLKQIISFTNRLSAQFNLRKLRSEATAQTVGQFIETQPKEIHPEWKAFLIAWSRICLMLPRSNPEKFLSFNENSKVIELLPDSASKDHPICVAFQQLSDIQNEFLRHILINEDIVSKYPYLKNNPLPITQVQDAAEGNLLLGLEISKQIETIVELTSYPDSDDTAQGRLTYNWNAVEESLTRNFLIGKHFLVYDNIRGTQFKGELPRDQDADIVRVVIRNIPQRRALPQERAFSEEKLNNKSPESIENLYTSLNIILVHLTKSKFDGKLTLESICKGIRNDSLPYDIMKDEDLKDVKIELFIQLYEKVEEIVYPEIESRYTSNFNAALTRQQESALEEFIRLSEGKSMLDIILQGLKRFVLRYLDNSLVGTQELKHYIALKEGLWPMDKLKEIKNYIEEHFPSIILVENTVMIISRINEYMGEKKKKYEANMRELLAIESRDKRPFNQEPTRLGKGNRENKRDRNFL